MALLQAIIVALIALIIAPGYLFYFDVTPKVFILLAGVAAALLAGAVHMLVNRRFASLMAGMAASLVVSSVLSANPGFSWFGGNWRSYGAVQQIAILLFAYLVAANIAPRPERVRTLLRGVAIAAALCGAYGVLQYAGIDPLLPAAAYHVGEGLWTIVRPPGTLGYVSYFANWLAMASLLCLALARMETRRVLRLAAYSAAAMSACAMALTGTRGASLAAAAGCATLLATRAVRLTPRSIAIVAALIVACVAFWLSPSGWNLHSRARWFREDPRGGARLHLWRDSLAMSLHRLPAGFGPEVFEAQFPHYESKQLAEAYPDFAHESPHNMFLDALVAQGIPGLVLLAALCAFALARAPTPWLLAAMIAGIVAQQFTVFTVPTSILFFSTLALSGASASPSSARRAALLPRLAAAIPAAAMLYLAFRFAAADRSLELAHQAIARDNGSAALKYFGAYERERLPGAGSDLWYSRAMSALAERTPDKIRRIQIAAQAGYAALRAPQTAEDPYNAWYNLAVLYANSNDRDYAERSLRSAIAAHPNWFKPHWMLARVLQLEDRRDEARIEAQLAIDLDGGKHAEVAETLRSSTTEVGNQEQ